MTAAIETDQLSRSFDGRVAVDRLTVRVEAGTVFGFLGPNGAGKTTTVRLLAALIAPTSGRATVAGYRIAADADGLRRNVGILTEAPGLYERLSALENLVFFAELNDVSRPSAIERARGYLRQLDLEDRIDDPVATLSKGMRQKLAIVRALIHDPAVVFLDEPTAGLDPEAARTVRDFIRELRSEGRTIFLTTHDLSVADELCDEVAIFRTRLLRVGSPGDLRRSIFGSGIRVRIGGGATRWVEAARAVEGVSDVAAVGDDLVIGLADPDARAPAVVRALVVAGAPVGYVQPLDHSLEEVYLQLVRSTT